MKRTRILLVAAVAVAAIVVALIGGVDAGPNSAARAAAPVSSTDAAVLKELLSGLAGNDTARYVRGLERRLEMRPHDRDVVLLLGLAYEQRARETGDPRFYTLAGRALAEARGFAATRALAETGLASLAVSRHRFATAIPLARAALNADPSDATAYGALGDAYLNSGSYRRAFKAYDRMAELSPSVASYGRVAHARELLGRPRAALEALRLALTLPVPVREHRAAGLVQLGNIELNMGDLAAAREAYRSALAAFPGYVHAAAGLAHVAAESGDFRHALPQFRRAVDRLPLPQYAIWRGDALRAAGLRAEARRAYALVSFIGRVQAANGVRIDLQTALFDTDHGLRLAAAVQHARAEFERAPSIDAADVLAWALTRNGHCGEALPYSVRALRLRTLDALKFFHRAAIERCLGDRNSARAWARRAIAANPHFSLLWEPVARRWSR